MDDVPAHRRSIASPVATSRRVHLRNPGPARSRRHWLHGTTQRAVVMVLPAGGSPADGIGQPAAGAGSQLPRLSQGHVGAYCHSFASPVNTLAPFVTLPWETAAAAITDGRGHVGCVESRADMRSRIYSARVGSCISVSVLMSDGYLYRDTDTALDVPRPLHLPGLVSRYEVWSATLLGTMQEPEPVSRSLPGPSSCTCWPADVAFFRMLRCCDRGIPAHRGPCCGQAGGTLRRTGQPGVGGATSAAARGR